ncbi:unnamed protein product, partial [Ectocarpus sp. 6 AP-2014]
GGGTPSSAAPGSRQQHRTQLYIVGRPVLTKQNKGGSGRVKTVCVLGWRVHFDLCSIVVGYRLALLCCIAMFCVFCSNNFSKCFFGRTYVCQLEY